MDNPYQSPKVETSEQPRARRMSGFSVAAIWFVAGYLAAIAFWYFTLPGPGQCPPPCDGPGMVFVGIILFGGPLVGIVSAGLALVIRALGASRRRRHAA